MPTAPTAGGPPVLDGWSARRLPARILLYVTVVFVAFMAMSRFVFHSITGVQALAVALLGYLVALVPGVLSRVEYRVTETALERRWLTRKKPGAFQEVFRWDDLSRIVPMKGGFKYYRVLHEPNLLRRFWKAHLSDAFSGEIHVEAADRERVLRVLEARGAPPSSTVESPA